MGRGRKGERKEGRETGKGGRPGRERGGKGKGGWDRVRERSGTGRGDCLKTWPGAGAPTQNVAQGPQPP